MKPRHVHSLRKLTTVDCLCFCALAAPCRADRSVVSVGLLSPCVATGTARCPAPSTWERLRWSKPRSGLDGIRDFASAKEEVLVNAFHRGWVFL